MGSHRHDGKRRLDLLMTRKTPAKFRVDIPSTTPFIDFHSCGAPCRNTPPHAPPRLTLCLSVRRTGPCHSGKLRIPDRRFSKEDFYTTGQGNQSAGEILNGLFLS
jgi:hypothetical protein